MKVMELEDENTAQQMQIMNLMVASETQAGQISDQAGTIEEQAGQIEAL